MSDLPNNVFLRRQRLARWEYYMSSIFDGNILPKGWDDNKEDKVNVLGTICKNGYITVEG